jgi:hypothetical protein
LIVIDPKKDSKACVHCRYYITVYGVSVYSLLAALESTIPKLSDGGTLSDHVDFFKWNRYEYVDSYGGSRDIRLSFTVTSGYAVR